MFKQKLGLLVLYYLRFFARKQLAKNPRAIIIGITGSNGKTSTRLALNTILKTRGQVKHSAHANSESGIPLNILGIVLKDYSLLSWLKALILAPLRYLTYYEKYDYYIVEMGIDSPHSPKNMDFLLSIVQPDACIILGASLVHAAAFDHLVKDTNPARKAAKILTLIANEKMKLASSLKPRSTAVLNADNQAILAHKSQVKARLILTGNAKTADYRITKTIVSGRGFQLEFSYLASKYILKLPDPFGVEYGHTFVMAIALAHSLGIPINKAVKALANFRSPAGRMRVFNGVKKTHLLDSSYNASPASMTNALLTLKKITPPRNLKIAVIGDMNELGTLSKTTHQDLAKIIPRYCDQVYLYGSNMKAYVYPYLKRQKIKVYWDQSLAALTHRLLTNIKPNAWILIKGSQNKIMLERLVKELLKDPTDQQYLCRRGPYWEKIRRKLP